MKLKMKRYASSSSKIRKLYAVSRRIRNYSVLKTKRPSVKTRKSNASMKHSSARQQPKRKPRSSKSMSVFNSKSNKNNLKTIYDVKTLLLKVRTSSAERGSRRRFR